MKNDCNKYTWNDSVILENVQNILKGKSIVDLEINQEDFEMLEKLLNENITLEEINQTAYIIAKNVDELNILPDEDIKDYILRLKNYLNNSNIKGIIAEFKGVEFEVHKDSNVEDLFNYYYSKYDEMYGISQMLSDLGLK